MNVNMIKQLTIDTKECSYNQGYLAMIKRGSQILQLTTKNEHR